MEADYNLRNRKSLTITKKMFSPNGTMKKEFIRSMSYYGHLGWEIEFLRFNQHGKVVKHVIRDEKILEHKIWNAETLDSVRRITALNSDNQIEHDEKGRIISKITYNEEGKPHLKNWLMMILEEMTKLKMLTQKGT